MTINKLTADALVDGTLDSDAIGPASVTHQKLHSNIISGQTAIGAVDASNDLLLIYDNDATGLKKVPVSSVGATNTDGISEGSSNLYYTNARADARAQLKIDALVDSAPGALDTLNELAAALGDDANFSTTITNSIATKMPLSGGNFTGSVGIGTATPAKKLHIRDSVPDIRLEDTNTNAVVDLKGNTGTGSFVISTDVNNAIANSKIIFEVDNDEKVRIDDNGNVGIGTNNPLRQAHIHNTASSTTKLMITNGATGTGNDGAGFQLGIDNSGNANIEQRMNLNLTLTTNNNPRITILANGKVGIGDSATSPNVPLMVKDSSDGVLFVANTSAAGGQGIGFFTDTGNSRVGIFNNSSSSLDMVFNTGGYATSGEAMRIDNSTKYVGIGTTSPGSALHVVGPNETTFDGITTVQFFGESNYNSGDAGAGIIFGGRYNSSNNTTTFAQISGKKLDTADTTYDGVLTFGVRNDEQGVNIERMRITNTGNVGIGTTSPTQFLEVSAGAPTIGLHSPGQATNQKIVRIAASQYTGGDFSVQQMNDNGTGCLLYTSPSPRDRG